MFQSAEFWVAVAFVIFWGILFYYGVPGKVLGPLDSRGKRITNELAEARRLREDAEKLLSLGAARIYTPKDHDLTRMMGEIADLIAANGR